MKRILIILCVAVLFIVGAVWIWNRTHNSVTFGDGTITANNSSSSSDDSTLNNGLTTDSNGTIAHPSPSHSDDPGTINTDPVGSSGSQNSPSASSGTTMGTPMASNTPAPAPSPVSAPGGLVSRSPVLGPGGPLPASDSMAPIPPNHVGFGGTGKYMWYREGDITYRVNSDTGARCVAFATMQEWAKSIVYSNGCEGRRG